MLRTLLLTAVLSQAPPAPAEPPPAPVNAMIPSGEAWRRLPQYPGWELRGITYSDGVFRYSATRRLDRAPADTAPKVLFGVVEPELAKSAPNTYQASGPGAGEFVESVKARSAGMIADLADVSNQARMTLVLPPDQAAAASADLAGTLRDDAAGLLVQSYPPDHWALKQVNFPPGITFQDPGGKVLYRLPDYSGGPDQLRAAIRTYGKARVPDPHYDPEKDPGPGSGPGLPDIPPWAMILGAGLAGLAILSQQRTAA